MSFLRLTYFLLRFLFFPTAFRAVTVASTRLPAFYLSAPLYFIALPLDLFPGLFFGLSERIAQAREMTRMNLIFLGTSRFALRSPISGIPVAPPAPALGRPEVQRSAALGRKGVCLLPACQSSAALLGLSLEPTPVTPS